MARTAEDPAEPPKQLQRQIDVISSLDDINDLLTALDQYAQELGFQHTTIVQMTNPLLHGFSFNDLCLSTLPDSFLDFYIAGRFFNYDPLMTKAFTSEQPFAYRDIDSKLGRWAKKFLEASRSIDIVDGVVIPIRLSGYPQGMASFSSDKPITSSRGIDDLEILSKIVFRKFADYNRQRQTAQKKTKSKLTSRQKEVITHIACGKTDQEIADIMNIAKHSVAEHAANIREKIGAKNRAHSVMIAIRDGYISL